jgi:hypothetical protein
MCLLCVSVSARTLARTVKVNTIYSFKYNQQDATLYNILYYCQCSTCFRLFLRPSSGAQNSTHSIWYAPDLFTAIASGSNKQT